VSRPTKVVVAGTGAIGAAVTAALTRGEAPGCTLLAALDSRSTPGQVAAALAEADVLVEATSVEAARELVPAALAVGTDVVVCSCGVLAEAGVLVGPGRVLLPAGALGGFDVLAAAARAGTDGAHVRHTTVKRPAALGVDPGIVTAVEVFRGTAREAAIAYPRTSNSSVALALATLGLDRVEVVVVADPGATITRHEVLWTSPIGSYRLSFENAVDPASGGRTSAITAWSVVELVAGLHRGVGPGAVLVEPRHLAQGVA
jgi:aspartate dehydrogenase